MSSDNKPLGFSNIRVPIPVAGTHVDARVCIYFLAFVRPGRVPSDIVRGVVDDVVMKRPNLYSIGGRPC